MPLLPLAEMLNLTRGDDLVVWSVEDGKAVLRKATTPLYGIDIEQGGDRAKPQGERSEVSKGRFLRRPLRGPAQGAGPGGVPAQEGPRKTMNPRGDGFLQFLKNMIMYIIMFYTPTASVYP